MLVPPVIPCSEDEEDRAARIEKRKKLFSQFNNLHWRGDTLTSDDIVRMIREDRENRPSLILADEEAFSRGRVS